MTPEQRVTQGGIASTIAKCGHALVVLATLGVWPSYGPWTAASIVGAFVFYAWAGSVRRNAISAPDHEPASTFPPELQPKGQG